MCFFALHYSKTFGHLPNQRKLNKNILNEALALQNVKPNKKLLLQNLSAKSGNTILLKDITNISRHGNIFTNDLSSCIPILQKHNCQYEMLIEGDEFRGLFFQNNIMKKNFAAFPEIVFLDGTYKLLNFNGVVYLFLVEDSVGSSEIAGVGILVGEVKQYIDWLISSFKIKNENSNLINSFMTDKDENMRNVLNSHFPEANLNLCKFHVFQIFKREITTTKLGINPTEKSVSLEYLQKISYSKSPEEYNDNYEIMTELLPIQVMQYYNLNWHPIKKQWVDGFINNNFLNFTNNRTESLNRNLKSIIKKLSSLQEFLENLFVELQIERTERDHRAMKTIHKLPVINSAIAPIKIYSNILTQFCF